MSLTSFPASAASPSDSKEPVCEPLHSVKSNPTAEPCLESTGLTCQSLRTLENSQQQMFPELTLSAVDSRAKTSASQERAPELGGGVVDCGENMPVLLAKLDPDSSSWKTSQLCLDGGLMSFSETWPRSGLMRSGIAYRRPTLVPDNFGTEFGLWPTPNTTAFKGGRSSPRRGVANPERNNWQDWCSLVLGQRYPVPETAEQVMGFPTGHTAIEPSETPSCLRSPKSLAAQSCKRKD